jgi:hypothetical protein
MENKHTQQVDFSNPNADKISSASTTSFKQETLEEFIKSQPYYGYCTTDYKEGIEVGAKWQAERMYSEDDLRNAYRWGTTVNHGTKEHFKEWFEQFKKK